MAKYYDKDGNPIRERKGFFSKVGSAVKGVLIGVGVLAIAIFVYDHYSDKKASHAGTREDIIEQEEKFHDIILTNDTLVTEMDAISELMTYSQTYHGQCTILDSRQIPYTDIDIWGTEHRIDIMYSGTIKVGYDLQDLDLVVNNQKKEIYITLPKDPIVDNNLPQESVSCVQDNNIFNTIRADEVTVRLAEVKEEQMQNAINNGIYEMAEENMKKVIVDTMARLHSDYKVVFVNQSEQKA